MRLRWRFALRYLRRQTPWDTGVIPPELVSLIEEQWTNAPGRALDLGCGTGTNTLYLAAQGWEVTGIDFIARPITQARREARKLGVEDRAQFIVGDVRRLSRYVPASSIDLGIDIGCGHSLRPDDLAEYANGVAGVVRESGVFMIYAHRLDPARRRGLSTTMLLKAFTPAFELEWTQESTDTGSGKPAAWYRFRRVR